MVYACCIFFSTWQFDSQRSSLVAGGEKNDSSSLVADETQKDSSYGSNHPENGDSDAPPRKS